MNKIRNWCGYDWFTQERWGQIHKNKTQAWYDPSCVNVEADNSISLLTKPSPKSFDIDGEKVLSPNGVGLISCTKRFHYGRFEIKARLPKGKYLWPAFWMWSWDNWPPEIDIFEGYSSKNFGYFRPSINNPSLWNVESNVHTRGVKAPPARDHWLGVSSPDSRYIRYALEWRRDSLKFFYDDRLVRTVDDKDVMDYLADHRMNVVINNMIRNAAPEGHSELSNFNIKYFKYEQYWQ